MCVVNVVCVVSTMYTGLQEPSCVYIKTQLCLTDAYAATSTPNMCVFCVYFFSSTCSYPDHLYLWLSRYMIISVLTDFPE